MASYGPVVAPDAIAAAWGTNLASATTAATSATLPSSLGGVAVSIKDSAGSTTTAQLYLVSSGQINFLVPSTVALGQATVLVSGPNGTTFTGKLQVSNVAPAIFTANATGQGVPAAQVLRVHADGTSVYQQPFAGAAAGSFTPSPISLTPSTDQVYLILYGSGIRHHSLNPVKATINGVTVPVLYAGMQSQFAGLDQVNVGPLPASLAGTGTVNLILYVDGVPANTVQLAFQ